MTDAERREAARQFVYKWNDKGNEDQDSQLYWIDFLSGIVGMKNVTDRVNFEKHVIVDGNTKKIDAYIPETHTLIEQKSIGKPLDKKITNSGAIELTPYEQAKRYNDNLPYEEKARWIVTSNFAEIWIYDMNATVPTPVKISIMELQTKYSLFDFMVNKEQNNVTHEMEISVKAGEFVGLIYDALLKQYIDPNREKSLKSLNMLCVRLVFCLYAEDAHIFGDSGHMFHDYIEKFDSKDTRKALIELFKILDTPEDKRDPYDDSMLAQFPYVNGGLFAEEDIEVPRITDEIRDILLNKASAGFDWSQISPTIFGAVFESTLNPETRRSGGMHYTSIENIHKVIDPLFLDGLKKEFETIREIKVIKSRDKKLREFQNSLSSLTFLDPAAGSGNFLTETYLSLRRLENKILSELNSNQATFFGFAPGNKEENPIKVQISQFYGIEINDFAVTVAKTALWIAESQMLKETEDIIRMPIDFLPLKTNAHIVEGNALKIDWEEVVPKIKLKYIMGNPPFLGASNMSETQKKEAVDIFGKIKLSNSIDYVGAWYHKAAAYINGTGIQFAFVSTNSITQGEQVKPLWDKILNHYHCHINFAYRTFIWDSEASDKAHVHCVIIGVSQKKTPQNTIYDGTDRKTASNISPYLIDSPNILIESISKPICDVPTMYLGNKPADGGNLILTEEEKEEIIKREPELKEYIYEYTGAIEYINNKKRFCFWLKNASPQILKDSKELYNRLKKVKEMREASSAKPTREKASTPHLFFFISQPETNYLLVPSTSSKNRDYIPIGFLSPTIIASNSTTILPNATYYHFGVLESNVHMAWMRTVAGRLKSDYRYSNGIVYNTFPWPTPTPEQRYNIELTAQEILKVRAKYPKCSLATLYDKNTMPRDLTIAHQHNNVAVMKAYGFNIKEMTEADCVAALMKLYQEKVKEK